MESFTMIPSYQTQWTNISIQQLANYSLQSDMLCDEAKATITSCLSHIFKAGERIRSSGWVVLSVIADCLSLRSRGVVTGEERSMVNRVFLRFKTVSVKKTAAKLHQRMELEKRICEPTFDHIGRLRGVAWGEIGRFQELDGKIRLDTGVFRDICYVNKVLIGILWRLGTQHRIAYDQFVYVSTGDSSRVSYDAITCTKDVGRFAEQLPDGKVHEMMTYSTYEKGWNELARVVHRYLGKGAQSLTKVGKKRIMGAVMNVQSWQGINDLSLWAVMHIAMTHIMAYGKVDSIYRAIHHYKGDLRRTWHLEGWVIRYVAVERKDDRTFKVPGARHSVKLRQSSMEERVWYAARTTSVHGGVAIQEDDYVGMEVRIDFTVHHKLVELVGCAQQ